MSKRFAPHQYATYIREQGYASAGHILYQWTGTHWQPLIDKIGDSMAYAWIVEHDIEHASSENARRAHDAATLWALPLPVSTDKVAIPCRNGYVVVQDGNLELTQHDRSIGLQHVLNCDYNPDYQVPILFKSFLDQVLPDRAVQERVQEFIGYTLTSDARYQRAQFWLGNGANGKGVLANVVQAMHGRPETARLDALDGFRLSQLIGASLIFCDEAPRTKINEQILKSLIAGERVLIDRKYRDPVSVHIRAKWLVLGNHIPAVTDHTTGFWRRWDIVPFAVTVPEHLRDPLLVTKICADELSGVLNWALAGLIRLQLRGGFDPIPPGPMQQILHNAKADTNSVQAWHDECDISFETPHNTSKDHVYTHYREWCARNGVLPLASPRFWIRLKDIGPVQESRPRHGKTQIRVCNVIVPDD